MLRKFHVCKVKINLTVKAKNTNTTEKLNEKNRKTQEWREIGIKERVNERKDIENHVDTGQKGREKEEES
jgi:hypothetical protein